MRGASVRAINIMWDVDYDADGELLPTEIEIPDGMVDEEDISDYILFFHGDRAVHHLFRVARNCRSSVVYPS